MLKRLYLIPTVEVLQPVQWQSKKKKQKTRQQPMEYRNVEMNVQNHPNLAFTLREGSQ